MTAQTVETLLERVNHLCTVVEILVQEREAQKFRSAELEALAEQEQLIKDKGLTGLAAVKYLQGLERERRRKKA